MENFDIRTLSRLTLADLRYKCVNCKSCKNCPFYKKYDNYVCKIIQLYNSIGISILLKEMGKTIK